MPVPPLPRCSPRRLPAIRAFTCCACGLSPIWHDRPVHGRLVARRRLWTIHYLRGHFIVQWLVRGGSFPWPCRTVTNEVLASISTIHGYSGQSASISIVANAANLDPALGQKSVELLSSMGDRICIAPGGAHPALQTPGRARKVGGVDVLNSDDFAAAAERACILNFRIRARNCYYSGQDDQHEEIPAMGLSGFRVLVSIATRLNSARNKRRRTPAGAAQNMPSGEREANRQ